MRKTTVSFDHIPQLSKTDRAYAAEAPALEPFYRWKVHPESFPELLAERRLVPTDRQALVQALREQYANLPEHPLVLENIEALLSDSTFTVCTAHQPSLFLGPLYFIYKAISAINLAEQIQTETGTRIVPVFVLGSEDHDLDELNHATLNGQKIVWDTVERGAVGQMQTRTLQPALAKLRGLLGGSTQAAELYERVEKAYTQHETFGQATQALLHEFLGRFGLVVLNPLHPVLKARFKDILRDELLHQTSHKLVQQTLDELEVLGFKAQAGPREINLFFLQPNSRERIVRSGPYFRVLNSDIEKTEEQLLAKVESAPERFSPNVVLRPLYQERILPNLAYIGGGGELAYWLERKRLFEHYAIPFPMLVRRNSVLWLDDAASARLSKLGLSAEQFFQDTELLVRNYIQTHAEYPLDISAEMQLVEEAFLRLADKAGALDSTLRRAVLADARRQQKLLEQWRSRLFRVEKQKHAVEVEQIRKLKESFFPNNGLQERRENFLPFMLKYGENFLDTLKAHLHPLENGFTIIAQ